MKKFNSMKNISKIFSMSINDVSIKATTTDNLGFIGSGEGIAATSIVMISKDNGN